MRNQKESVLSSQNQPVSYPSACILTLWHGFWKREVFEPKLATGLQDVLAILKESPGKDENEADDSDDVASDHNLHDSDSEHNHDDSA